MCPQRKTNPLLKIVPAVLLALVTIAIYFTAYILIEKEQKNLNISTASEQKTKVYENNKTLQEEYKCLENMKMQVTWGCFLLLIVIIFSLIYSVANSIMKEVKKIDSSLQHNGGKLELDSRGSTHSNTLLEKQICKMEHKLNKLTEHVKEFEKDTLSQVNIVNDNVATTLKSFHKKLEYLKSAFQSYKESTIHASGDNNDIINSDITAVAKGKSTDEKTLSSLYKSKEERDDRFIKEKNDIFLDISEVFIDDVLKEWQKEDKLFLEKSRGYDEARFILIEKNLLYFNFYRYNEDLQLNLKNGTDKKATKCIFDFIGAENGSVISCSPAKVRCCGDDVYMLEKKGAVTIKNEG